MKQKNIILIVIVVIISGVASYFLSKALFGIPKDRQEQVEVVQKITSEFPTADPRYFNNSSIDPTQNIVIGVDQNPKPFNSEVSQ